ncbi:alcohol dehydrogenase, partial [Aspergillus ellipticus CBS 707.79]
VTKGEYTHHKATSGTSHPPTTPCSDMCGTITALGAGVTKWRVGDRVLSTFLPDHVAGQVTEKELSGSLGHPAPGVLAEYRVFAEHSLVGAPGGMSEVEASTLPIAGVTAWVSLVNRGWMGGKRETEGEGRLLEGKTVLVQGTGGVAVMGLLIGRALGGSVIVTSSSDEKLSQAKSLGATYTINYVTTPDWDVEVNRLTHGHGADIILETGGARTLRKSFECIAFGGLINCIGYLSGKVDEPEDRVNVNVLTLRRNVTLQGIINGSRERFEEMVEFFGREGVKPVVNRVFGFGEVREAFGFMERGGHFGKVVVKVE